MATSLTGIREILPGFRNELPIISMRVQCELQHSESSGDAHFAVRPRRRRKRPLMISAGAHHEFADAAFCVGSAVRILRRESLVVMIMPIQGKRRVGVVRSCSTLYRVPPRPRRMNFRRRAASTGKRRHPDALRGGLGSKPRPLIKADSFQIHPGFPGEPTNCERFRLHGDFQSKPSTTVRGQELFWKSDWPCQIG